ncbi:MAG TPA: tRNA pseudouridine(13) synthase TruD [Candidatus Lokiarchaeia archaeon]|nr:tRNA pseudouridine(13) synthase TruD [Candidatus Lokiarchaeia archaeon]
MSNADLDTFHFSYEKLVSIRHYVTTDIPGTSGEIKNMLSDFIVQEITAERDVIKTNSNQNASTPSRKPARNGRKYTSFVLRKYGFDTIHAIEFIARKIGMPSSEKFSFAGIKDNQAITTQQVTVEGDYWSQLVAIAKEHPSFELININYSTEPVTTGDLWGNKFFIRIRKIDMDKDTLGDTVDKIIRALDDRGGFLNYFGLQRFGTHRPNSQWIGKRLVLEDYEGAINELLIPSFPRETEEAIKARKTYEETRDPALALEILPTSLFYEKLVLEYLVDHPNDYKGALLALPRTIVSLYTYSFQSYLFNEAVSSRFEKVSSDLINPLPYDIVALLDTRHGQMTRVRYVVSESNVDMLTEYIKLGKAAIVVPVIGSKTRINERNPFYSLYNEILAKEQVDRNNFMFVENFDFGINLQGVSRPLALNPRNLKVVEISNDEVNPGKSVVRFSFDLPKGTYATMFLREVMKVENQYL